MRILGAFMLLSGIIRWLVIDAHGFVPPFLDLPDMQSWVDRFTIEYQNLYTRYGALLAGVMAAYLMVYYRDGVRRFFSRTALVDGLSLLAIGLIIPTAYFALASPLFSQVPRAASKLYYSHHRDVFSLCTMFLILAAIHSAGFAGRALRAGLSWKPFYPLAQISYSLYLVHEMVMLWLFPKTASLFGPSLGPLPTMAVASVMAVVMSCVIAGLLYVFVEQPCMRARSHPAISRLIEPSAVAAEAHPAVPDRPRRSPRGLGELDPTADGGLDNPAV
jgi:peptidoglycan/LPS O-acetylase OafA/YrhL